MTHTSAQLILCWQSNSHQATTKIELGVTSKKKKSLFKDIIQIKVDHPPTYPILDKLFFDKF